MKILAYRYCSYFLLFLLSACGVKGPLYIPPSPKIPVKPASPEPQGRLYPQEASPESAKMPKKDSPPNTDSSTSQTK